MSQIPGDVLEFAELVFSNNPGFVLQDYQKKTLEALMIPEPRLINIMAARPSRLCGRKSETFFIDDLLGVQKILLDSIAERCTKKLLGRNKKSRGFRRHVRRLKAKGKLPNNARAVKFVWNE